MQQFYNWRFDVSGMTPAQLRIVINALNERIRQIGASHTAYSYLGRHEEEQVLRAAVERLERALPENRPMASGTVV